MGYGQYCALARSLDLIGDRWTLLIVRELLAGERRYGEMRAGLPGIPSNLLADRLRRLERDELVSKVDQRYRLTTRGEALRPVVRELIRWGEPLMLTGRGNDGFSARWLLPALDALVEPGDRARVDLHVDGETIHVVRDPGRVSIGVGSAIGADAEITGPPEAILGIAAGHLDLADAVARRVVECTGDVETARSAFRRRSARRSSSRR